MPDEIRVASPPPKPLLIFDGDCGFCRRWVARWQQSTGPAVDYLPYQDEAVSNRFPEIARENFEEAVHLISPDGSVCCGAEAVFRSLAASGRERWLLWCYRRIPSFPIITETVYDEVAAHRDSLSTLDRWLFGENTAPRRYALTQYFFLRGLALIYLIAFASLWVQLPGLIGSRGIAPAEALMQRLQDVAETRQVGLDRYHVLPTLGWWTASDRALQWQCAAGVALLLLALAGVATAPALFLLWTIYLSLSSIGSPFLNFQWDTLLLETGFLAIFFAPLRLWERPGAGAEPPRPTFWLLRWLVFRLMFESGWVKLASHDPLWLHLTALRVHFETQPLPTWVGWYAHQLPGWMLDMFTLAMFVIELAAPFLIFCGRKPRQWAAALFVLLQTAILLTGNYTFFNWLTILLCVPLLDDDAWRAVARKIVRRPKAEGAAGPESPEPAPRKGGRWTWKITAPLAILVFLLTCLTLPMPEWMARAWPRPIVKMFVWLEPFRSFNGYGLFARMTPMRPEIIVEGSNDGQHWEAYEFKYKPGDLKRAPGFVAPYQPRLDWQMWFAALGKVEGNGWFLRFEYELLQNSPTAAALLARNPFASAPPKFIRAELYEYHFTDWATRRATGQWWRREYLGVYAPPLTLKDFGPAA